MLLLQVCHAKRKDGAVVHCVIFRWVIGVHFRLGAYWGSAAYFVGIAVYVISIRIYIEARHPRPDGSIVRDAQAIYITLIICGVLLLLNAIVMIAHVVILGIGMGYLSQFLASSSFYELAIYGAIQFMSFGFLAIVMTFVWGGITIDMGIQIQRYATEMKSCTSYG